MPVNPAFFVTIRDSFESAHSLRAYFPDGTDEPLHGHSWRVEVALTNMGQNLDDSGICVDFLACQQALRDAVALLDHRNINEVDGFRSVNPTTENICAWFFQKLDSVARNAGGRIKAITVWEGPNNSATMELA